MELRSVFRWLLAVFFVAAGVNHFRSPGMYLPLMPPYLPWHMALIQISGVAEIMGGLGVLAPPRWRRAAGWGLMALLVAVFPANVHAAWHGYPGIAGWILWVRLPLQGFLMAWVYASCVAAGRRSSTPS